MIGMKIKAITKDNFFNSEAVMKALSDADRKVLSRFGAYVRTTAKQSIRPAAIENRKEIKAAKKLGSKAPAPLYRSSEPGKPPRSRRGELKKFILFGYEPEDRNVVIGPTLVQGRGGITPGRLERGGTFTAKRSRRQIRVAARPYMRPAFDKEMKRMPAMFADSLSPAAVTNAF